MDRIKIRKRVSHIYYSTIWAIIALIIFATIALSFFACRAIPDTDSMGNRVYLSTSKRKIDTKIGDVIASGNYGYNDYLKEDNPISIKNYHGKLYTNEPKGSVRVDDKLTSEQVNYIFKYLRVRGENTIKLESKKGDLFLSEATSRPYALWTILIIPIGFFVALMVFISVFVMDDEWFLWDKAWDYVEWREKKKQQAKDKKDAPKEKQQPVEETKEKTTKAFTV